MSTERKAPNEPPPAPPTSGSGSLTVVRTARGASVLSVCRTESPLKILTPKNRGDAAWVIVATFGGGLVAGDRISLSVDVERGASLFLGSQSSQKVFRGASSTRVAARVRDGALLVVWPDPLACFGGANHMQDTLIEVDEGGSVVVLDAFTAGRPAHEPPFSFEALETRTRVLRGGAPAFIDGVRLGRAHAARRSSGLPRFGDMRAFANLFALGPRGDLSAAVSGYDGAAVADAVGSAHTLEGGRSLVRVAATRADRVSSALSPFMRAIAQALGDDPFGRRGETSLKQDETNVTPASDEALST
jgi:urease accessory protein